MVRYSRGVLLGTRNQLPQAEAEYRAALGAQEKAEAASPPVPGIRGELGRTLVNLALVTWQLGRPKDAEPLLRRSLEVFARSASESPGVEGETNLATAGFHLSSLLFAKGELKPSRTTLEEAITHQQNVYKADPKNAAVLQMLLEQYAGLTQLLLASKDHAAAMRTIDEAMRVSAGGTDELLAAARFAARCVALAEQDAARSQEKRTELASQYGDRAVGLLRDAVKKGYRDAKALQADADLAPLRMRKDYAEVLDSARGMK